MQKMTRSEVLQELNELIHDYPVWFPSAVRQGLKDALAALEDSEAEIKALNANCTQLREESTMWFNKFSALMNDEGRKSNETKSADS